MCSMQRLGKNVLGSCKVLELFLSKRVETLLLRATNLFFFRNNCQTCQPILQLITLVTFDPFQTQIMYPRVLEHSFLSYCQPHVCSSHNFSPVQFTYTGTIIPLKLHIEIYILVIWTSSSICPCVLGHECSIWYHWSLHAPNQVSYCKNSNIICTLV